MICNIVLSKTTIKFLFLKMIFFFNSPTMPLTQQHSGVCHGQNNESDSVIESCVSHMTTNIVIDLVT
jgi:hypothetical protein